MRYTENGKVLDYLEDFPDRSLQTVEFGKNLTDVKITRDHTERVTALIPLGAKLTETDEDGNETETDTRLDITAVNDARTMCTMRKRSKKSDGSGRPRSGRM